MPKISSAEIYFDRQRFRKEIYCDSKGNFTCKLPPTVAEVTGFEKAQGKTIHEVNRDFEAKVQQWKESRTEVRKVIAWKVKAKCEIQTGNKQLSIDRGEVSFAEGIAIDITAAVLEEIKVTGNNQTRLTYKVLHSSIPQDMQGVRGNWSELNRELPNVIDWSEERETFFANIGEAMHRVILELEKLRQPANVICIADNGIKFLQ